MSVFFALQVTFMYMVCCVFKATNLVNNYGQRKSVWTFVSKPEKAINYIRLKFTISSFIDIIRKNKREN
ncbi:MAG: hypothetical protein ACI93P_002559 [bacterium]|jgi:hypothetical protein